MIRSPNRNDITLDRSLGPANATVLPEFTQLGWNCLGSSADGLLPGSLGRKWSLVNCFAKSA
jgi:hypothetical protein